MKKIITFEPPETVVVVARGKLDPNELKKAFEEWATYKKPEDKFRLLVDCSELEELSPAVREIMREEARKFKMSKMAVYGASTKIRIMAGLIVKMVPNIEKSKFFETEAEARVWLEGKK
jgi:hypothetical protein